MERAERVIHQIYEAANNPEYWPVVCSDLSELVSGGAVHLLLASTETGEEYVNLFSRGDPEFAPEYLHGYADTDIRVPRVMAQTLGTLRDEREYISNEEASRSAIHQELLPRYGVHKISGANMSFDGCIGWFGIATRTSSAEFDSRQRSVLGRVAKHLLNGLRTAKSQQDLRLSRSAAFAGLDLVNVALIVFDRDEVEYTNAVARQLLEGEFFRLRNDVLTCTLPAESRRLARFLELAGSGQAPEAILLRNPGDAVSYIVRSHVFPTPGFGGSRRARRRVVSIIELDVLVGCGSDEVAEFCAGYGVSLSEAKVVHAVLTSTNLAEFAESRGVRLGTVQQQLKSAMTKMDLNSQKKIFRAFERYRLLGKDGR